jgi:hypothetical protein
MTGTCPQCHQAERTPKKIVLTLLLNGQKNRPGKPGRGSRGFIQPGSTQDVGSEPNGPQLLLTVATHGQMLLEILCHLGR